MENENDEIIKLWAHIRAQSAEIAELTRQYNELSKITTDYITLSPLSNQIAEKYDSYTESFEKLKLLCSAKT